MEVVHMIYKTFNNPFRGGSGFCSEEIFTLWVLVYRNRPESWQSQQYTHSESNNHSYHSTLLTEHRFKYRITTEMMILALLQIYYP